MENKNANHKEQLHDPAPPQAVGTDRIQHQLADLSYGSQRRALTPARPVYAVQRKPERPNAAERTGPAPPKKSNDYAGALQQVGKALLGSGPGKALMKKVEQVATSKEVLPVTASVAAALIAAGVELPQNLLKVSFNIAKVRGNDVKVTLQPILKGPKPIWSGEGPKEWGGTVTFDLSALLKTRNEGGGKSIAREFFTFTGTVTAESSPGTLYAYLLDGRGRQVKMMRVRNAGSASDKYRGKFKMTAWVRPFSDNNNFRLKIAPLGMSAFGSAAVSVPLQEHIDTKTVNKDIHLPRLPGGRMKMHFDIPASS